jgi:hypothetical protein
MNKEILKQDLAKYIIRQNYIDLKLDTYENILVNCIPIAVSNNLLYILRYQDFMPDGYEILQLTDIQSYNYSNSCCYFEEIVKKEGAQKLLSDSCFLNIINWSTVFTSLKELGLIVIVDIGKEDSVIVGRITEIQEDSVVMHCFSPTGVWDDEEWTEPYKNITGIKFKNHYTNIFAKHLPNV